MRDLQTARGAPLIDRPYTRSTSEADGGEATEPKPPPRRTLPLATVAAAVLALDVLTKLWVVERLGDRRVDLIGDVLVIRQIRNPGAAFGMAQGATVVFTGVAVAVVAVIVRTAQRLRSAGWAAALGLLLGGATGNLVDRVFRSPGPVRGHVVDFVEVGWWPLFNVADAAIVTGGLLAVLLALRGIEVDGSHAAARPAAAAE